MRLCCFSAWWHIRQRQGGDAEGGWPIPAGPESAQPPATIPQACLLADRGVHFLSLFTRGRGAEPGPRMPCSRFIDSHVSFYMCDHVHASWHASGLCVSLSENRRFRRCSGKRGRRPPAVAVAALWHACIILRICLLYTSDAADE